MGEIVEYKLNMVGFHTGRNAVVCWVPYSNIENFDGNLPLLSRCVEAELRKIDLKVVVQREICNVLL